MPRSSSPPLKPVIGWSLRMVPGAVLEKVTTSLPPEPKLGKLRPTSSSAWAGAPMKVAIPTVTAATQPLIMPGIVILVIKLVFFCQHFHWLGRFEFRDDYIKCHPNCKLFLRLFCDFFEFIRATLLSTCRRS